MRPSRQEQAARLRAAPRPAPRPVEQVRITCETCGVAMTAMSDRAESLKLAHQSAQHYGHPWHFSVVRTGR